MYLQKTPFVWLATAALIAATMVDTAAAQEPGCAPGLDDEVRERTAFIEAALDDEAPAAKRWWWGWTIGYSAVAIGEGVAAALVSDRDLRVDLAVGSLSALLGALGLLIMPLDAAFAADELADLPDDTPEARVDRLAAAESLLDDAAESQLAQTSWVQHALTGAWAVASGAFLWLVEERVVSGLIQFGAALVGGEARILTLGTGAATYREDYSQRFAPEVCQQVAAAASSRRPLAFRRRQTAPTLRLGGLGFSLTF